MFAFERRVALRFLREGRMQSLLIVVGVAAGVAWQASPSAWPCCPWPPRVPCSSTV